ncbi:MAG: hypothetical protein SGJ18_11600 [Pseudomonadota bacterium]|nr:hypothetical protein [Pseudomonadota bacterium]
MTVKFFKAFLGLLVVATIVSACGSNARNRKARGVTPQGGPSGSNQKAAAGLDRWLELEKKKPDSDFNKSAPDQSTFDMSRAAIDGYKNSVKSKDDKIEQKNQALQALMGHVEISTQKKDDTHLAVSVKVFSDRSETKRRHLVNFTGDITPKTGIGQLKAEILDDDLKQLLDKQKKQLPVAPKPKKSDLNALKGERFTGDAKCFDPSCYNILIRIFDNKERGFLAYLYRVVNLVDQKTVTMAKILSPLQKSMAEHLKEGDFKKDGYHFKLDVVDAKFSFKSEYTLSLVKGEFYMEIQISQQSSNETPKIITGSGYGTIADQHLEEYTVLLHL